MPSKKRENNESRQIFVPLVGMIVVILVLLSLYFAKSMQTSRSSVTEGLYSTADTYANDLRIQIETMTNMAIPSCEYLSSFEGNEEERMAENYKICQILASTTDAETVLVCNNEGEGMWDSGEAFKVGECSYYSQIFGTNEKHLFRTETKEGSQVLISCVPFDQEEEHWFVVMIYNLSEFQRIVKSATFDLNAFIALTDTHGTIILHNGSSSKFLQQEGILDFAENTTDQDILKFRTRMRSKSRANVSLCYNGDYRELFAVPVNVSDMYVVAGLNKSYVDRRVNSLNRSTTLILRILLIVVLAFGAIMAYVIIANRLKASKKKMELEEKADTDLLTGLNNKLATERKIKEYMKDNPNSTGMMVLIDLDNFKKINDTRGHAFGDEVLRTLGKNLSPLFRVSDIVGRIGGDEFMVFLKGISELEDIEKQSGKIVQFFRSFQAGDYVKYSATASIGVALYPKEGADFDSLYKAADAALYSSKRNGKNQVAFYDESMKEVADKVNN